MNVRANNLRVGMIIEYNKDPHKLMSMNHITPGKGNAVVQTKLRNLRTGIQTENRFRATEDVNRVVLDTQTMEYLYNDGDDYFFMNVESYEQVNVTSDYLGEDAQFLTPNLQIDIQFYEGQIVGIELPKAVELVVEECPPYIKGATATNQPKPATMETGLIITVPNFISPGEKIRIDTAERKYLERAKN